MKKTFVILLTIIGLAFALPLFSQTGPRYALLIGNSDYQGLSSLKNPVNDAQDLGSALKRLGFSVEVLTNGDLRAMEAAVLRFSRSLAMDPSSVGFFYYAGHGVQSQGNNFLIPSGAVIPGESFLPNRALSAQAVLGSMQGSGNALNLIVLDACRDNPFGWARSGSRGLSVISQQPPGSIIVYATTAGSVALDGEERNGVFTGELLKHIETPNLDLGQILNRTAASVQRKTGGQQVPAVYQQYFDPIVLNPGRNTEPSKPLDFGPLSTSTGSLLILLDSPGKVTLLGQSVDVPGGGSLPVNNIATGPVDILVEYADGQRERRNVVVSEKERVQVRFSHALPLQPPTDVYVYNLQDTRMYLNDQTSLYAYIFELKSGENRISPRFTRYMLPEYRNEFDFSANQSVDPVSKDYEFTLFTADWTPSQHKAKITSSISRSVPPETDLANRKGTLHYKGELIIEHPEGRELIIIDEILDLDDGYKRTSYSPLFQGSRYKIEYKIYYTRDSFTVEAAFFHPRPKI